MTFQPLCLAGIRTPATKYVFCLVGGKQREPQKSKKGQTKGAPKKQKGQLILGKSQSDFLLEGTLIFLSLWPGPAMSQSQLPQLEALRLPSVAFVSRLGHVFVWGYLLTKRRQKKNTTFWQPV